MEKCAYHSDNVAIESCEVCGRPLCALCLWYGADGLRLCEQHAQEKQERSEEVFPPATYADAIQNALATTSEQQRAEDGEPPYKGNKQDVTSLVSAVLALTALFSCCVRTSHPFLSRITGGNLFCSVECSAYVR